MNSEEEFEVQCPHCGAVFVTLIDTSFPQQNYVEDCQVCCAPIVFDVEVRERGELAVSVSREND